MKNKQTLLKLLLIVPFLLLISKDKLFAQLINRDSLKRVRITRDSLKQDSLDRISRITNIAKWDARGRKLNKMELLQFKADEKNNNSDLFKPAIKYVSNTSYLFDSLYVKTFRNETYHRAVYDNSKFEKSYWFSFGLGANIGSNENGGGINAFTNLNIELGRNFIITPDIQIATSLFGGTNETNYSIFIGKIFKKNTSFVTVSTGLAYTNPQTSNFFSSDFSNAGFGIPILIQGYVVVLHTVGLGIHVFANWSTARSTAGFSFSLAFGSMLKHDGKLPTN